MDILVQTKMLLGITGESKNGILAYLASLVTGQTKQYCHLPDASNADLQNLIVDMVITRYRARGYGSEATPQNVSAITEDKVKVEFKTPTYVATSELTDAEKKALIPFRKLWPS